MLQVYNMSFTAVSPCFSRVTGEVPAGASLSGKRPGARLIPAGNTFGLTGISVGIEADDYMAANLTVAVFKRRRRTNEAVKQTVATSPDVCAAIANRRKRRVDGVECCQFVGMAEAVARA